MCGISGWLPSGPRPDPNIVVAMTDRLSHRGPDYGAVVALDGVILGHRRLSIIDLSEAGRQPMADHTGNFWIVFNGEIYNYPALRQELEGHGHRFASQSDTEVILEAYKRWGVDCLQHLVGMFAFAIWDASRARLFLARDRLGEKPLFYQRLSGGGMIFASELKALRQHPEASSTISPAALSDYLTLNYIMTDRCIFEGVEKLPPAHYLTVERDGTCVSERYWDLAAFYRDKQIRHSESAAAEELAHLLDGAVRGQMISDVPLGAFLSGGIDSSAVVSSMARQRPAPANETFSLGFPEKSYSELDWSDETARLFGIANHRRVLTEDVLAELDRIVYFADEPFADTSVIPLFHLAAFARRNVTVCLSGDGADEILCGYETYVADKLRHLTGFVPRAVTRTLGLLMEACWPPSFDKVSTDYKLRQFLRGHAMAPMDAHCYWRTIFADEEKRTILRGAQDSLSDNTPPALRFGRFADDVAECHYLDQAMYVDIKTWLADDILVKVDRATMSHSLEARVPFLDHRLVEFAASLPVAWKLKGLRKKHILKLSQERTLPDSVLNRKKRGFNAPVSHWFSREFQEMAKSITLDPQFLEWFDGKEVERLWQRHVERKSDNGLKLFGLTCLGIWMNQHSKKPFRDSELRSAHARTELIAAA